MPTSGGSEDRTSNDRTPMMASSPRGTQSIQSWWTIATRIGSAAARPVARTSSRSPPRRAPRRATARGRPRRGRPRHGRSTGSAVGVSPRCTDPGFHQMGEHRRAACENPGHVKLSVVIPARDEEGALPELFSRLARVLGELTPEWEVVIVDDGSGDGTWDGDRGGLARGAADPRAAAVAQLRPPGRADRGAVGDERRLRRHDGRRPPAPAGDHRGARCARRGRASTSSTPCAARPTPRGG